MPDPSVAALGFRERGEYFPGWERYGPAGIDIGLSLSLSVGRLRDLLGTIRADYPKLELRFVEADRSTLVAAVAQGTLDLAFVLGDVEAADCVVEKLWAERLLVALYEDHPLCRDNSVSRQALRDEQFLVRGPNSAGNADLALLEGALEGRPRSAVYVDVQRETMLNMVGMGFGLSLIPVSSLGAYYPGVVYKPFEGAPPSTWVNCIRRADNSEPELDAILGAARDPRRAGSAR